MVAVPAPLSNICGAGTVASAASTTWIVTQMATMPIDQSLSFSCSTSQRGQGCYNAHSQFYKEIPSFNPLANVLDQLFGRHLTFSLI
jgi:hypothetical protein